MSASRPTGSLSPLQVLLPAPPESDSPTAAELVRLYGGPFSLPASVLYANFVASLDGVAVVGPSSGSTLSGRSQADRFVMGLLRAWAGAIVIGSGTLRGSPGHVWSAEHVFPAAAQAFSVLRQQLGLPQFPTLVVVSGSGKVDLDHPGLSRPALILTSKEGERHLGTATGHQVQAVGEGATLDANQIVAAVRRSGHRRILTEGGPTLLGQLLQAHQVQQMFLTVSPLLAGRTAEDARAGFVEGVDLLGEEPPEWLSLVSAHHHKSHLFLRYLVNSGRR